jgi:uncharacterized LabA/DUF88 family protein
MVADDLRRQADQFIDIMELKAEIGRDPAEREARRERQTEQSGEDLEDFAEV